MRAIVPLLALTLACTPLVVQADDTQSSTPDERVAIKVTYEAVGKTVSQVLADLAALSNVKLYAGANDADWHVRDRKLTVSSQGASLASLMNSISHVTDFSWQSTTFDGKKAYRLYQDPEIARKQETAMAAKEQRKQEKMNARRAAALNTYDALASMSAQQLENLRTENPLLYRIGKSGLARDFAGFLHEAPDVRQALAVGGSMSMNGSQISPLSQQALVRSIGTMRQLGRRFNPNTETDAPLGDISAHPERMSIQINPEMMQQGMMRAGPAAGSFMGGAVVMFDDHVVGMVPVFDPESEMAKLIGKAWGQMENNPDAGFEGLAGMQGDFIAAVAAETKRNTEPTESTPKPADPELEKKIKLKASFSELPEIQSALAKASGYCVVSDYFAPGSGARGRFSSAAPAVEKELTIRAVLDDVESRFKIDWQRQVNVLEFRDKDWYAKRQSELPLALVESWRQQLVTTGNLNIDIIAAIAALTPQQIAVNIGSDPVLSASGVTNNVGRNRDVLSFYSTLAQPQRAVMFSAQGLDLRLLDAQQMAALQRLLRRDEAALADPSVPLVMYGQVAKSADNSYSYVFTMVTPARPEPQTWSVPAPRYVPPKK